MLREGGIFHYKKDGISSESEPVSVKLRRITPKEMLDDILGRMGTSIRVSLAGKSELITIPDGWHGAGASGEALVQFGDILTKPLAGTELDQRAFTSWLEQTGFQFTSKGERVKGKNASRILSSDKMSLVRGEPILRMSRPGDAKHVPIEIEIYGGAQSPNIRGISAIGNLETADHMQKFTYKGLVAALFNPFLSFSTADARKRMGLPNDMPRIRRIDDCSAAFSTILADMVLDDKLHGTPPNVLEIIDVAIATTHSMTLAVALADLRHRPLLLRVGVPAFGLLPESVGLNYMGNTLPAMRAHGPFTSGDIGTLLDEGDNKDQTPHVVPGVIEGAPNQIRLFLGGGWPIYKLALEGYNDHPEVHMPPVVFIRAKRVDNGPTEWGLLMSGIELTQLEHTKK